MAYDAATGQVVLFGGLGTSNADLGDTWTWNGTSWTSVASGPSARHGAAMAYDAALGEVILFGGDADGTEQNDTWAWDGTSWTQLSPPGTPAARNSGAMAYDAALGEFVLFGGENVSTTTSYLNDTWVLTGTAVNSLTWTQQTTGSIPGARDANAMVYDAARGQVVMFGGYSNTSVTVTYSDTWTWGTQQDLGNMNVCPSGASTPAPCSNSQTLTYYVSTTTDFGAPKAVTQGATGLDFLPAGGSTCVGNVSAGSTCTVNVTFTPGVPGLREGAVELFSSSNSTNPLVTTLIYGTGEAPLAAYSPLTSYVQSTGSQPLNSPEGVAVDAADDLFIANTGAGNVVEVTANDTVSTVGSGLKFPESVAVDGAGDVFIGQYGPSVTEVPVGCTGSSCR